MVFFREIFALQLVGLVLTYNFTDCNFEKIKDDYQHIIFGILKGTKCTHCIITHLCENQPDCLTKIERLTSHLTPRCTSFVEKLFAMKTNATFTLHCPGYPGRQINNTQAMKKKEDTINECQEIISNLKGLWGRFTRF